MQNRFMTDLKSLPWINSRRRHVITQLSLVLAVMMFCCSTLQAADRASHPNIVVLFVDDMGYGDPGCFNSESKIPTPNIDRLAAEGMRFTDAHAPGSVCVPSRYGLLTGRYPFRTRLNWREEPCIEAGRMTVASLLKEHGYHTSMVGKWHLGFHRKSWDQPLSGGPVDRGFDTFFGIPASTDIPPYYYIRNDRVVAAPTDRVAARSTPGWSPIQGAFWREGGIAPGMQLSDVLPTLTDRAVTELRQHHQQSPAQPCFLYLASPAPHTPWLPSEEFLGRSRAGLYGDFVVMVDHMLGRVMHTLEELGMRDDTLVVFTSDNGPVWFDDDVTRLGHDSAGGLRGMKGDAWEAGHRVPFIAHWPGQIAPDSVSTQIICHTDLLATCAAIVGDRLPNNAGEDSYNMLPVFLGQQPETDPVRDSLVVQSSRGVLALRSGDWKLIPRLGSGGFSKPPRETPSPDGPQGQLYDLSNDLAEEHNRYQEHPEVVTRLAAMLEQIETSGRSQSALPSVKVSNIRRVFHNGEHNAFTDLCRFQDRVYLTFRSCPGGHGVDPAASIIVLATDDMQTWQQVHRFQVPKRDTRDPHFLVFEDKLIVYTGTWYCGDSAPKTRDLNQHLGYAVVTTDGKQWHAPQLLEGTYGHYIWRAATHGGKVFLCGRRKQNFAEDGGRRDRRLTESAMLESDDGLVFKTRSLFQEEWGDETAFLFEPDGQVLAIGRRSSEPAEICRSVPPYTQWERTRLDRYIGGPLLVKWGDRYVVGGRKNLGGQGPKTSLCWLIDDRLEEFAELPSGGDNSYPGFVALDDTHAVVSWYSSHERDSDGKTITAIYLADLELSSN